MTKWVKKIVILLCVICPIITHATQFNIENFRVGPNPLIIGSHNLVVNYTSSVTHTTTYYLYTTRGEQIFKISDTPSTGTIEKIIKSAGELSTLTAQLYIVIALFKSGANTIVKKAYVVAK